MELITSAQCRAARALLNWSQPELAERCGMHVQTISSFEQQKGSPTKSTLEILTRAIEEAGIELTKGEGVRFYRSDIVTFEGKQGFMDDVYETAAQHGGDIYLFNSRPGLWYEWLGKEWYDGHSQRMADLGDKIKVRITVQEGDDFLILNLAEHKWFPKDLTKNAKGLSKHKIFYAYGPKLGFLDFGEETVRISVMTHKDFADIFRSLYDVAWENVAIEIPRQ